MSSRTSIVIALTLAALASASPIARAQDDPPAPVANAKDAYAALGDEYAAALKQWRADCKAARAVSPEKEAALKALHPAKSFWPRYEQLVAGGDGRGLLWMVEGCEELGLEKADVRTRKDDCVDRLVASHCDAEWAASDVVRIVVRQKFWFDEDWVRARLRKLTEVAKNKETAAAACYELALRLDKPKSSEAEREEAGRLLARVRADFKGTRAAETLHDKESAADYDVGGTPDFSAADVDGAAFKLSDYRGKVVLLDFWGFW